MAITLTVSGSTYDYPEETDQNWGAQATLWAQAVSDTTLQLTGGAFTLTSEVDFGDSFGIQTVYLRDLASNNPADSGFVRLGVNSNISWRNNADNGNLQLGVNGSDQLTFNGATVGGASSLGALSDVTLTSETTNDLFQYNGSVWVNVALNTIDVGSFNDDGTYASSAQGLLADTALQPGDNVSALTNDAGYLTGITGETIQSLSNVNSAAPTAGEDGYVYVWNNTSGEFELVASPSGSGDVVGPASAVSGNFASYDGTTGKLIQDSGSSVSDFATSAQGSLADTAVQPGDNVSVLTNDSGYLVSGDNVSALTNDAGYLIDITSQDIQFLANVNSTAPTVGEDGYVYAWNNTAGEFQLVEAGDVVGPASSTDSNFALFDGITGKLLKDTNVSASDFATATQGALADTALQDLADDTSPTLGGDLNVGAFEITAPTNDPLTLRGSGASTIALVAGTNGNISISANNTGASQITVDAYTDVNLKSSGTGDVNIENTGTGTVNIKQPVNTQTGTSYTVVSGDVGRMITLNNASAITLSVNTGLGLTAGESIDILQLGAGQVTVGGTATVNGAGGANSTNVQYSAATLYCTGTDTYVLIGDIV